MASDVEKFRELGIAGVTPEMHVPRFDWLRSRTQGETVLSLGCAFGRDIAWCTAQKTANGWVTNGAGCLGVEILSGFEAAFLELLPDTVFLCHDILQPRDYGKFGVAILSEVLEHIRPRDVHGVVETAWKASEHVLITTPNGSGDYYGPCTEAGEHSMIFTPEIWRTFLNPSPRVTDFYKSIGMLLRFDASILETQDFIFVEITGSKSL